MQRIHNYRLPLCAAVALILQTTQPAKAHFLWLKSSHSDAGAQAVISFGESALEEDYKLPESVDATSLWWRGEGDKKHELSPERVETDERIVLEARLPSGDSRVLEATCTYGIYHTTLLKYYAKYIAARSDDELAAFGPSKDLKLDLVPKPTKNGLEIQALWNGKPHSKVAIKVIDSTENEQTGKTGEDGRAVFDVPAKGLVHVLVSFVEKDSASELDGATYKDVSHYATLTFASHADSTAISATTPAAKQKLADGELPALPEPVASFGAAVLDGWLYVYSGHTGGAHEHSRENLANHFRRISLDGEQAWENLPMETPLQGFPLVAYGDALYRIGGMNARNASDADEDLHSVADFARFDPADIQWTALPSLPMPLSSHDAVVIGDKLYVAGGWKLEGPGEGDWNKHAMVFDFTKPEKGWQMLSEQPFQRRALATSYWQRKLAVLGGINSDGDLTRRVDFYDLDSGQWSRGPDLPGEDSSGFGVSAWNLAGKMYVNGSHGIVYRLSDDGKTWLSAGELATPRFFHRLLPADPTKLLAVAGASFQLGHLADVEFVDLSTGQSKSNQDTSVASTDASSNQNSN